MEKKKKEQIERGAISKFSSNGTNNHNQKLDELQSVVGVWTQRNLFRGKQTQLEVLLKSFSRKYFLSQLFST